MPYSHRNRATRLQVHILCVSLFLHQFHHLTSTTEECTDMTHFRDVCRTRRPYKVIDHALQVRKRPPLTLYPPPPNQAYVLCVGKCPPLTLYPPPPPTRCMYCVLVSAHPSPYIPPQPGVCTVCW